MKKEFFITAFLLLYYAAFSTPVISNVSATGQVCIYDKFEISFTMTYYYPNDPNPYDPEIKIYPNPSSGEIKITSESEIDKVYVFDHKGSLITSYDNNFTSTITIDLSSYKNGFYFIKTQNHNGYTTNSKINKIE